MELSPEARRQLQQMLDGLETKMIDCINGVILGEGQPVIGQIRAHYDEISNHKILLTGQEQRINDFMNQFKSSTKEVVEHVSRQQTVMAKVCDGQAVAEGQLCP